MQKQMNQMNSMQNQMNPQFPNNHFSQSNQKIQKLDKFKPFSPNKFLLSCNSQNMCIPLSCKADPFPKLKSIIDNFSQGMNYDPNTHKFKAIPQQNSYYFAALRSLKAIYDLKKIHISDNALRQILNFFLQKIALTYITSVNLAKMQNLTDSCPIVQTYDYAFERKFFLIEEDLNNQNMTKEKFEEKMKEFKEKDESIEYYKKSIRHVCGKKLMGKNEDIYKCDAPRKLSYRFRKPLNLYPSDKDISLAYSLVYNY